MLISGLIYIPNFITDLQQDYIVEDLDLYEWSSELKRRVQHYGYKYNYRERSINETMKVQDLLPWMKLYGTKMFENQLFKEVPDQVIVNEYTPGQGIGKHIDCEPCFKERIASLSLLSGCTMEFHRMGELKQIYLEPKSLLILTGEARYDWMHGIPSRLVDNVAEKDVLRSRRLSITFRNVIINS